MAIIGAICLVAAFLASFLPETLNEYLPQRAQDSAEFGSGKAYFSLANMTKLNTTGKPPGQLPIIKIELDATSESGINNNVGDTNGKI